MCKVCMIDPVQGFNAGKAICKYHGKARHPLQDHRGVFTWCSTLTGYPQGIAEFSVRLTWVVYYFLRRCRY